MPITFGYYSAMCQLFIAFILLVTHDVQDYIYIYILYIYSIIFFSDISTVKILLSFLRHYSQLYHTFFMINSFWINAGTLVAT